MKLKGTTARVVVFGLLVITLLVLMGCSNTVPVGDSTSSSVREDTGLGEDGASDIVVCPPEYDGPSAELFPSFSDEHTVVLWLFDDPAYPHATLGDAGGNEYDLRLMEGGGLASGVFGTALHFAPRSGYEVSFAGWQGAIANEQMREEDGVPSGLWSPTVAPKNLLHTWACGEWTLEFRLRLASVPAEDMALLDMGDAYAPGLTLYLTAGGAGFRVENYYGAEQAVITGASGLSDGAWHHVAVVRSGGQNAAYLDGALLTVTSVDSLPQEPIPPYLPPDDVANENRGFTAESTLEWRRQHRFNISLGEDRRKLRELHGSLDELRISSVARYADAFVVPDTFSRNYGPFAPKPEQPSGPPLLFGPGPTQIPIPLGSRKHVFIDTAFIDSQNKVKIKVNTLDAPERLQIHTRSGLTEFVPGARRWRESFYDHDGKVLLFISDGYSSSEGRSYLFESTDGVNFSVPELGLIENSTDPNLVFEKKPMGSIVFKDENPNAGPEEPFKMSSWTSNRGIYLYHSPNGLHWRRNEVAMLPLSVGGDSQVFWDDQRGVYFNQMKRSSDAPTEQGPQGRAAVMFMTDEPFKAWPFERLAEPYFEAWPFPLLSDEGVTVLQPRVLINLPGDLDLMEEVFRPQAMKYTWAPDVYLALPHRSFFRWFSRRIATELAVSRDGEHWTDYRHCKHRWYMPLVGQIEGETVTEALSLYGLIRRGDEIWVYVEYTTLGASTEKDGRRRYARLRHPLDRFAALNAGRKAGWVVTHPFVFDGELLELNVNASHGAVRVAILDEEENPLPGYTIDEFDTLEGVNGLRVQASWGGSTDVSPLSGQHVRLRFELDNAKIYAMQFVP